MFCRSLAAAILFLAAPMLSSATETRNFTVKVGNYGALVPVVELAPLESNPGEAKEVFLARAALWFRNYTSGSGYEACASVCSAPGGRTGLIIATANSQLACQVTKRCPDGFSPLEETIHSHPMPVVVEGASDKAPAQIKLNAVDVIFVRASGQSRAMVNMSKSLDPNHFSDGDVANGAGYLVTPTQLLFQDIHANGVGTKRVVADLPAMEE